MLVHITREYAIFSILIAFYFNFSALSVQVLNVWTVSHVTFPSVEEVNDTSWDLSKDFLHLPMQALLGTASNGTI